MFLLKEEYHSVFPLEEQTKEKSGWYPYSSCVYKVTQSQDGVAYCLKRIVNCTIPDDEARASISGWLQLVTNPSVVPLRDVFSTTEFGDAGCKQPRFSPSPSWQLFLTSASPALCFVYDFFPGADSLHTQYLRQRGPPIHEDVLWSFVSQLISYVRQFLLLLMMFLRLLTLSQCSALSHAHAQGLAVRNLHPTKVLLTQKNRIRISSCGILDVLQPTTKSIAELQVDSPAQLSSRRCSHSHASAAQFEDLTNFGKLILELACRSPTAVQNFKSERFSLSAAAALSSPFSRELVCFAAQPIDGIRRSDVLCRPAPPSFVSALEAWQIVAHSHDLRRSAAHFAPACRRAAIRLPVLRAPALPQPAGFS